MLAFYASLHAREFPDDVLIQRLTPQKLWLQIMMPVNLLP